jgi:RNA polymerase sigma-70 factor (ECF subfamily)
VAFLAARTRDLHAAEDAVADALTAAAEQWTTTGIPANPEAWLLTTARRRMIDSLRRRQTETAAEAQLKAQAADAQFAADPSVHEIDVIPDERLKLLFTCAHPAIDQSVRTPLLLQAVLGLDAARVASAFLVSPTAMGQRLVRAKTKIRDAGIAFEVPERPQLPERLEVVMQAIYAAYSAGWDAVDGVEDRLADLAAEAIDLARLLCELMPDEPEPKGLAALMLHSESRRAARRSPAGEYVPLADQDTTLWNRPMMAEAEHLIRDAARFRRVGPYQVLASIQSAHASRAATGATPWNALAAMYDVLLTMMPTPGVAVARAAALAEVRGPVAALAALDQIDPAAVGDYQSFWAVRAHLLAQSGDVEAARQAYQRAIGLCDDTAMRAFLVTKLAKIR